MGSDSIAKQWPSTEKKLCNKNKTEQFSARLQHEQNLIPVSEGHFYHPYLSQYSLRLLRYVLLWAWVGKPVSVSVHEACFFKVDPESIQAIPSDGQSTAQFK